jgi:hypothetical protein
MRRQLKTAFQQELRFLLLFGVIETDQESGKARATAWLEEVLADRVLELPAETFPAAAASSLIVQPNLEVLAPPGTPLETHEALAQFGDLKSLDRVGVYSFSLQSLHCGITILGGLEVLERLLPTPLPHAFAALIQDARARSGEISFLPCSCVISIRQPYLGKALEALGQAVPLPGAPGFYLLPAKSYGSAQSWRFDSDEYEIKELMKKLKAKGYFPLISQTGKKI